MRTKEPRVYEREGFFWIDVYVNGKRIRKSLDTTNLVEANIKKYQLLAKWQTEPPVTNTVVKKSNEISLVDCLQGYINYVKDDKIKPRTKAYISGMETQMIKLINGLGVGYGETYHFDRNQAITSITHTDLSELKKDRIKHLKPATISHELRFLRAAINHAKFMGFKTPELKISTPPAPRRERYFSNEEFKQLYDALSPEKAGLSRYHKDCYRNAQHLALYLRLTGARWIEVANLRFRNINFEEKLIVMMTAKRRANHTRILAMPGILETMLSDRMERAKRDNPDSYKNDLVFPAGDGEIKKQACRLIHKTICKLGFNKDRADNDRLCVHSLRHAYAVHALASGEITIFDLAGLLGHQDVKTTQIYAKHVPSALVNRARNVPVPF